MKCSTLRIARESIEAVPPATSCHPEVWASAVAHRQIWKAVEWKPAVTIGPTLLSTRNGASYSGLLGGTARVLSV